MAMQIEMATTKATVLPDFNMCFLGSSDEQVKPSTDSQRVLKNGVTGFGPEKLLQEMLRYVRLVRELKTTIFPSSILLERSSDCNCVRPDMVSGISPVNLLELKSKLIVKLVKYPISGGIGPERRLKLKSRR
ncbi:alpha-ketoglutarate dehydrogenase complex subunit Kgd1, partial [Striga asiatica]